MSDSRENTRIYNKNKFKLGLFGMNCSGGLSLTKAKERWDASWDNNVKAAQLADDAGLEFLLPIGRWHGYQGSSDTQGTITDGFAGSPLTGFSSEYPMYRNPPLGVR